MDPNAALALALDNDAHPADRLEAADGLREWLRAGGAMPDAWTDLAGQPFTDADRARRDLARTLAQLAWHLEHDTAAAD